MKLKKVNIIEYIKIILSIFIFSFSFISIIQANTINDIYMDIYIDHQGNAVVNEVWDAYLDKGTEGYRSFSNLGNSKISNFSIVDEEGISYEALSNWNVSASFSDKAYKNGLHNTYDGVELCWGISKYGNKKFTLKYNISNFVNQYTDAQGIYFNLLNLDEKVNNAKIIIHSDTPFMKDNSEIWAFGNNGTINFENGNIVMDSNGSLTSSQYMVALVKFKNNIFNISNKNSQSFEDIYNSAFSDVKDNSENKSLSTNIKNIIKLIIITPFYFLLNPVCWLIFFLILSKIKGKDWFWGSGKTFEDLDFGQSGKQLPDDNQINYWREIPCNKDLEKAYWICYQYDVVPKGILKQGIIGAIFLKWIKKGYVEVKATKDGIFNIKDNNYAIDFSKMQSADNELEEELFKMVLEASGGDKVLESKEFKKWSKIDYYKVDKWFKNLIDKEEKYLEEEGLITISTKQTTGMFGKNKLTEIKNVNSVLKEEAIKLKGLKKFLLDFSIMPERKYIEVHIWEEYLIFAELLGIADKVAEQFSKLYPKFNEESLLNQDITTIAVISLAKNCYEGLEESSSNSVARSSSSYSRGRGGRSHLCGGSSSKGSSGGGFR